jgi:glycosyltransferase involved in cell wall biosynthesis
MRIALLGSVNPKDFGEEIPQNNLSSEIRFGRSMPVVDLAESLSKLGHEVLVVSLASGLSNPIKLDTIRGITLKFVPARRAEKLKAITFYKKERIELVKAIDDFKPEIVHAHWTYEYALAAEKSNSPHLITVHDAPLEIFKDFRNFFFFLRYLLALRVRLKSGRVMVYVSQFILDKWKKQMFIRSGPVIPNMLSLDTSLQEFKEFGNNILSVGNANRGKNIQLLLDAWAILAHKSQNINLHIVGPGLGPGNLLSLKSQGKAGMNTIVWHGALDRKDLNALYRECHVLVHPSLHESFGLVILEAFAYKLAVIALEQAGGTKEVIGDAGILVKSPDAKLLADSISELMSNPKKALALTEIGSKRLSEYSASNITVKYVELYSKVINTHGR